MNTKTGVLEHGFQIQIRGGGGVLAPSLHSPHPGFIHGNSSRALLHPPANNSGYAYAYRHCTGTKLFICTPPPRDFGPRVQLHYFFCYTCSTPYSDSLNIAQMLSSTTSSILLLPLHVSLVQMQQFL